MAKDQSGVEKVAMIALSFGAGWVAQKIVEQLWEKSTGGLSHDIDDDDARIASVVTFAAVSAAVAALTQVFAKRGARKAISRISAAPRR
ncbi:DUF4235 domain-containing protein [Jonesiaceae bacterium BS-20]|uniref:DUF4235 domain-containing protein n=1 Tax=Jonesiaceae bacterium BS-20 TaxID=3120821 RepID=A0AAU7DU38_9MICO